MATGYLWLTFCTPIITSFASASLELTNIESATLQRNQADNSLGIAGNIHTTSSRSSNNIHYSGITTKAELPTSIEVNTDSNLYIQPGQPAVIHFEVTNHKYTQILYDFEATSTDVEILGIQPPRSYLTPGSSTLIKVTAGRRGIGSESYSSVLTFTARWSSTGIPFKDESVSKKVFVRSGHMPSDSSNPVISFTYNGACGGYTRPKHCEEKFWRADITVQDSDAGLLMLKSYPVGLILNKEFIVGTTEEVTGYYKANCCLTKADITAKDIYGNEKTLNIDIERIWLSSGEIVAIVLGCILLVILLILLIFCIIRLCRRRRSLSIYPESRSI